MKTVGNGLRPHDWIACSLQFEFTVDDLGTLVEMLFNCLRISPPSKEHIVRLEVCFKQNICSRTYPLDFKTLTCVYDVCGV